MARPQDQQVSYKMYHVWARKWSKFSNYSTSDLGKPMKKLLIYYPKHPSSLTRITSQINSEFKKKFLAARTLRKLYQQIISRYKPSLIQSHNLDLSCDKLPFWPACYTSRSLRVHRTDKTRKRAIDSFKKVIKSNKRLVTLELEGAIDQIWDGLKYVRSLRSLSMNSLSKLSLENLKKVLLASRFSLEEVMITGGVRACDSFEAFRAIFELPKLKRFRYDGPFSFDIDKIPFTLLQKRKICYDIRHLDTTNVIEISTSNEVGLRNLELLALNYKVKWVPRQTWDLLDRDYLEKQENSQSALSLNLHEGYATELSELFSVCRNIKVLHITLAIRNDTPNEVNYEGLRNLAQLEHLFIELSVINKRISLPNRPDKFPEQARDLFGNLKHSTKKLKSLSFHLCGEGDPQYIKKEIPEFFEACAETVTHLTFKATFSLAIMLKDVGFFYKAMAKLKRITSLKLIYDRFSDMRFEDHSQYLQSLIADKDLEELYISADVSYSMIAADLAKMKGLKKLSISCWNLDTAFEIFTKKPHLQNSLQELEISFERLEKDSWYKVLSALDLLKNVEILKIKVSAIGITERCAIQDLKVMMGHHDNLKLIAYRQGQGSEAIVISAKDLPMYSEKDIDDFFGRGIEGLPVKVYLRNIIV